MRTHRGFTIIEGLLILVIVGILGFTGWYVYNARNNTNKSAKNADSANSSTANYSKKTAATDPTASWIAYSSKDGVFSLKYPKTWVTATHPELCSPGILLLGANTQSVGVCGSESFGQVSVASVSGDSQKDNDLSTHGFKDVTTSAVTIGGVTGQKQTGTSSGQAASGAPNALPDGIKVTKYVFFTNSKTYTFTYTQASTYPDVLSDFDLMVTKTLKFSS